MPEPLPGSPFSAPFFERWSWKRGEYLWLVCRPELMHFKCEPRLCEADCYRRVGASVMPNHVMVLCARVVRVAGVMQWPYVPLLERAPMDDSGRPKIPADDPPKPRAGWWRE